MACELLEKVAKVKMSLHCKKGTGNAHGYHCEKRGKAIIDEYDQT